MLRSCVCFGRQGNKRRSSSLEDSSSCRSSEIARCGALAEPTNGTASGSRNNGGIGGGGGGGGASGAAASLLQLFQRHGWYRHWRKSGRNMSMTKVERTIKSALLIQRWYRRYLARMEMRRKYTWTIFQSIEYAGEQDQVELYNFFNDLLTHIPHEAHKISGTPSSSREQSMESLLQFSETDEEDVVHDKTKADKESYKGISITIPLKRKDVDLLIDMFRKKKNNRLHPKYVAVILRESAAKLKRLPNFNIASTAISKQVTVCGDLHGKLDDLLVVFHKNGLPTIENPYVFNGDFVDRGKKGLEVLLLLLACFLAFPSAVFLNRGNHEDAMLNGRYGFAREMNQKYKRNAENLMKLIEEVYRWLPIGTIVNNRVLIVHGGICDTTDLDMLKSIDRGKYVSLIRPPIETSTENIDKSEWKQIFNVMWSDPQTNDGCSPNTLRGAGMYFGPDITDRFLDKNKFKCLIRSHECKPDGYEFTHNDRVITIFSASNYYAMGSNKGAYLKLNPQLEPHFVQYISGASKARRMTFKQRVGIVESSALRELGARLRENRENLEREFKRRDPKNRGFITIQQWCDAMEYATRLGLPWRLLREKLAPMPEDTPTNEVYYCATLELLETDVIKLTQENETSVADSLYTNKNGLEAIFHILDKDNSGTISLDEFADACAILEDRLHQRNTRDRLMDMCKMMDINKDGQVDLNEFLEAFRLCQITQKNVVAKSVEDSPIKKDMTPAQKLAASQKQSPKSSRTRRTVEAVAASLAKDGSENDEQDDIDVEDYEAQPLKLKKNTNATR